MRYKRIEQNPKKQKLIGFVQVSLIVLISFYFIYHLMNGRNGLLALVDIEKDLEEAHVKIEEIRYEKADFKHRIDLLYEDSLDLDLLEEQAKKNLGYIGENEMVIYH